MNTCCSFGRLLILLIVVLFVSFPVGAEQALGDRELIGVLRQGGYNIYFRHEATDWSQQDLIREEGDWLSCDGARVRQLSEAGRQSAARTGQAMRRLGIPVGEVLASPYCRAMETARQLGLGEVEASTAVINMRVAEYFGGRRAVIATARELLSSYPAPGTNRVIVAHGNVARSATPVYPGEGEAVVFEPDGAGSFDFVGRITPDRWDELAQSE